jgi:A/G-specific adenine glycosylase
MLLISDSNGRVLLERRAPAGIWGGLWSFPELASGQTPEAWIAERLGAGVSSTEPWPEFRHGFTHFELAVIPHRVTLAGSPAAVMEADRWLWYNAETPARIGRAAIVDRLLAGISGETDERKGGEGNDSDGQVRAARR